MAIFTRLSIRGAMMFASLGLLAAPAAAQVHFTPFAGAYYSASTLGSLQNPQLAGAEFVQASGVLVGANLDLPVGSKFGIELAGSFALSDPRFQITTVQSGIEVTSFADLPGWIAHASLAARLDATQTGNFFLFAGPGMSYRGGDAWEGGESSDLIAFGGVAGLGVLARVAPGFTLDVRVEAFVHSFDPDGSSTNFDSALNTDILVKLGLRLPG